MNTITVTINGKTLETKSNHTILHAARNNGIAIPTLCYLEDVNYIGSCRLCMVEIEGYDQLFAACKTKVKDGMVIHTESETLTKYRREMLKLLVRDHIFNCESCGGQGSCQLKLLCGIYGIAPVPSAGDGSKGRKAVPVLSDNPYISYDASRCIHCFRCVNACHYLAGNGTLKNARAGAHPILNTPFGENWKTTNCESCGNCAAVCPTGAIRLKRRESYDDLEVRKVLTTCPYCATGCQMNLVVKDNRIINVEAADGPANHKRLCVKGQNAAFDFIFSPDRLKTPLIKDRVTGKFKEASWEEAIRYTADRFLEIREKYGPDSLAGFSTSRSTNEDIYMVQKMVRTCFKTNNADNCARVCHSATVAGLARTLGSGAMTNPIGDITKDVDCILLVGSNPEEAHPVTGMQIRRAVESGTRLIVVDPRDIGLSEKADIHLKIRPGTNVAFANGMMHVMIEEGLIDEEYIRNYTEGFSEIRQIVSEYTPEKTGQICHIDPDKLREAARMYATAKKAPIIYCLGVTEHSTGTEGVMSMSNMAAITGKIGKSGCGVNPLRGQNNVQGACDMGAQPGDFPGYQKVTDPVVLKKFEDAWGVKLNPKPGITSTEVFPAAIEGRIRGLFLCGEDPVVSEPDSSHVIKALESLDFLAVQELFMTPSASYADVIFPAVSYAEKEGTFTNTERRVQRVRRAVALEGGMRPDTEIVIDLMNAMGYPQKHLTPAQIMDEIAELTPAYRGISHERLDSGASLQWPCTSKDHPGTPIMHAGGPARGKVLLYPAKYRPAAELPDEEYPFLLSTGRILYHYNAASMTMRSPGMSEISGEGFIEMNTEDAARIGISNGDRVVVKSRRGRVTATARTGSKTSPGEVWMPFHFPDCPVNFITNPALDEFARIPEYKVCAVSISALKHGGKHRTL